MKKFTLGNSKEQVLNMIPKQSIKKVLVGEHKIALLRIEDNFHAFQASCPHRGASLLEGTFNQRGEIICPLHHYRFDLNTGDVKAGSCGDLEIYRTELKENGLEIILP
ncbi:Rieske (2Fe-2S) protein [Algoriphagus machipongonensis]|uniref:Nitrite reductase [NAD(P)H], small subunit n=1 Tax=Algoriphagus machipongonensis TaxID=388413 RepID=A3HVF1_9BACT|nr:Rieske (2Fe-2S) protein [Algoriphagus machipongonensis]EAZ82123.1 nitrite reductase [NAD(P)H], small subunit [Algoriphagus machipongonensis]